MKISDNDIKRVIKEYMRSVLKEETSVDYFFRVGSPSPTPQKTVSIQRGSETRYFTREEDRQYTALDDAEGAIEDQAMAGDEAADEARLGLGDVGAGMRGSSPVTAPTPRPTPQVAPAPAPTAAAPAPAPEAAPAPAPAPTAPAPAPTPAPEAGPAPEVKSTPSTGEVDVSPMKPNKKFSKNIQALQQKLIKLGYLAPTNSKGKSSADGFVGPDTNAAYIAAKKAGVDFKVDTLNFDPANLNGQGPAGKGQVNFNPATIRAGKEYYAKGVTAPKDSAGREALAQKGRTLDLQKLLFSQGFLQASDQTGRYDAATREAVGQAYKKLGKVPAKGEASAVSLRKLSQLYGVPVPSSPQPFAGDLQDKDVARQNVQTTRAMGMTPSAAATADLEEGKIIFKKSYVQEIIREELQRVLKKKLKK